MKDETARIILAIPAYNEERTLKTNVQFLLRHIESHFPEKHIDIVIADNNSFDRTGEIAEYLSREHRGVSRIFVGAQGKGNAVIDAWNASGDTHDIFIFMDADLATDIKDLGVLIVAIEEGYDMAIGSRYLPESRLQRKFSKRMISRSYRLIARLLLGTKILDLPCGFKAINKKILREIVPNVGNRAWFFDSEIALLAEKEGLRIKEIPVSWKEPRKDADKSKVNIFAVSAQYIRELLRMRKK